ncbi:hypothetical protein DPMN_193292 [Dreissena polymorpha]|nr:hypothetical protein DPMN_193292 [Dreissena polymorpha]
MDVLCSGCLQPSLYCLSVSAWMYCALGVYNQVFTAFLCQHGCIVLWVFTTKSLLPFCVIMDVSCSEFTAKSLLPFCVNKDVLCSVFTTKSLLPFCFSMDVLYSGCSQHSHYCLSVSAWIYLALGVHSIVITSFLCQHRYILLWVFTA